MLKQLSPVIQILFLAFLAEALTEYLAAPLVKGEGSRHPAAASPLYLRYIAVAVGVLLALAYRADLLAMMGLCAVTPWVGYIVTGILIGRGSNFLNDLVDRWLAPAVPRLAPAAVGAAGPAHTADCDAEAAT